MSGKLILFQGDSITDGNRYKDKASEWDLNHQIGHAYPYVIAATLGARHPERGYMFKNRGVSGNQIAELYGRWTRDTLPFKPDILSVLIGVNDQGEFGSDPARYERIYRAMLDEAREANPAVKFVSRSSCRWGSGRKTGTCATPKCASIRKRRRAWRRTTARCSCRCRKNSSRWRRDTARLTGSGTASTPRRRATA